MTDQAFVRLEDGPWRTLTGQFARVPEQVKALIARGVTEMTEEIAGAVREELPSRTGTTRRSVRAVYGQQDGDAVVARVVIGGAGALLLGGTRAHVIEPNRARALRFVVNGQVVFAKRVYHPGTRPDPYVNRALNRFGLTAKTIKLSDEIVGLLRVAS